MVGKENDKSTGRHDRLNDGWQLVRTGTNTRSQRPKSTKTNPSRTQPHVARYGQHCHAVVIGWNRHGPVRRRQRVQNNRQRIRRNKRPILASTWSKGPVTNNLSYLRDQTERENHIQKKNGKRGKDDTPTDTSTTANTGHVRVKNHTSKQLQKTVHLPYK